MYTTVKGRNGVRYMKEGRFVKKDSIPADILIKLDVGMKVEEAIAPTENKCIFCNMPTKEFRLLNSQPAYLCEEHYYEKTLGEVAKQVRENSNG